MIPVGVEHSTAAGAASRAARATARRVGVRPLLRLQIVAEPRRPHCTCVPALSLLDAHGESRSQPSCDGVPVCACEPQYVRGNAYRGDRRRNCSAEVSFACRSASLVHSCLRSGFASMWRMSWAGVDDTVGVQMAACCACWNADVAGALRWQQHRLWLRSRVGVPAGARSQERHGVGV